MYKKNILLLVLSTVNLLAVVSCDNKTSGAGSNEISEVSSESSVNTDDIIPSYSSEYNYTEKVEEGADLEFEQYLHDIFLDYLGDDYLTWNIFAIRPETFGFERNPDVPAVWEYYEPYEEGYMAEGYTEMNEYYDELKKFDTSKLTKNQMISYEILDEFFKSNIEFYNPENNFDPMMRLNYIDQFGGSAADFLTYMEAYSFWEEDCIKDAISYIKSLPESFATYATYCDDKANAGYPISDYTLDEMISYLKNIVAEKEDYYLIGVLQNKVNNCGYLSVNQKKSYCKEIEDAINNEFFTAYENLSNALEAYKGRCNFNQEWYLASYGEVGKKYYAYLLRNRLGYYNLDLDEFGKTLKAQLDLYAGKANDTIQTVLSSKNTNPDLYTAFLSYYEKGISLVSLYEPDEMLDYLKDFAKTIVPDLETTPEINVKYMDDASAKVSNAVAYYMKSALDNTAAENITLNKYQLASDYNDTLATLAHEGYPGHLYAYVFEKQLPISNIAKVMTSTAHGEGWATYVQYKLYEYLKKNNTASAKKAIGAKMFCDYQMNQEAAGYLAYTYIDYGIHYLGWGLGDVEKLMGDLGYNVSASKDIIKTLIEVPAQYSAYGYGMVHFLDIHNKAKTALGNNYNEIDFNKEILSYGWCSFDRLDKIVDNYIESHKAA